ncbi:sulfite exporter TauE/SafE family protein [Candidatus Karelsulcia muelleri]|uniref:sulfite exporter TauE/SafE family protein n=1 Tax=Candidatus Karelsulcia muelleri TaxID=336810 RepID=UPI000D7CD83A|nr:sulfite exporter TauE/SafE family protein [Candidatus Karelsulcia muelleri]
MEKLNCSYISLGFLLGIISSIHCFSMCGPLTFFFLKKKENQMKMKMKNKNQMKMKNKNEMLKKNFNNFNYQIGRMISYILLGYIFGTIGYRLNLIGYQKKTSLFLGGNIIFSSLMKRNHLIIKNPLYFLLNLLNKLIFLKKNFFFLKGLFNGLIPCSIVYIAISIAISIGKSLLGGIFMFYFGLGTVPMMFTLFSNLLIFKKILLNNITLFKIIMGFILLIRGLGIIDFYPKLIKIRK